MISQTENPMDLSKTEKNPLMGSGLVVDTNKMYIKPSKSIKTMNNNLKEKKHPPKILEFETMKLPKIYTPYTYIMYSNKLAEAKEKFKESMKEIGVNLTDTDSISWPEHLKQGEKLLKNSISVKYLGIKDGQIGILSKRTLLSQEIPKNKSKNRSEEKNKVESQSNESKLEFIVNRYSLPHQLNAIIKKSARNEACTLLSNLHYSKTKVLENNNKEKDKEIKLKIKLIVEKKKTIIKEKSHEKLKNSMKTWDQLVKKNELNPDSRKGFSYSSKIKELELGKGELKEDLKGKVTDIIKLAFHR